MACRAMTNYAIGGARTDDSNTLSTYGLNDGFTL